MLLFLILVLEELARPPYRGLLEFPDHSLEVAGRSCRNPDRKPGGPWCFVDGSDSNEWEYCNIDMCPGKVDRLPRGQCEIKSDN